MSGADKEIRRWTHSEGQGTQSRNIRQRILGYFMQSLQNAHAEAERDILEQEKSLEKDHPVLADYLFPEATLKDLRALFGAVEHCVQSQLENEKPLDLSHYKSNVFSISLLQEAIERTYGNEIEEFSRMWEEYSLKSSHEKENPFDVPLFLKIVNEAQIKNNMGAKLQNFVFLEIEQEILQGIGTILFEIKAALISLGVAPRDKIDDIILKRKKVFGSGNLDDQAVNDEVLFKSLVELLQGWEPKSLDDLIPIDSQSQDRDTDHLRPLNNQEIFSAIATLQQWAPKVLEEALGQRDGRLAKHIKEALIKQAESLGVPAGKAKISDEDEKAVDLVDEVFTQNLYERQMQQAARTILAQILFPSVKAAILNRRWFAEENHPARIFLVEVANACAPTYGEVDEKTMAKAKQAVDKMVAGFNEDISVFEVLTQEMKNFSAQQDWDKETDQEQEQKSRDNIKKELKAKWLGWMGPPPLMEFALQIGSEYLSVLDRNNERGSANWGKSMSVLETLIRLRSERGKKVQIDGILRDGLMEMLMACGWTGVRAHNLLAEQEDIIDSYYVHGKSEVSRTSHEIIKVLKEDVDKLPLPPEAKPYAPPQKQSSGDIQVPKNDVIVAKSAKEYPLDNHSISLDIEADLFQKSFTKEETFVENTPILPSIQFDLEELTIPKDKFEEDLENPLKNQDVLEAMDVVQAYQNSPNLSSIIQNLSLGTHSTWVNPQGELSVVRLSWISPISTKYLFVNNKGARVLVATPQELEEMALKGRFYPETTPDHINKKS